MLRPSKWFGWSRSDVTESERSKGVPHSLEQLKTLYNLLAKNPTVTEQNRMLLVETLRQIAEILIWGDQNDSTVFDFFLEKNMLDFFLQIMKQKCGGYVCTQLLQTLNILFENIKNETSLYYLLSNNHVNSIIIHKFDFDDEEVMAYYISFLKTLSLKLNNHTIHFFFNESTADFPLYTEAIKFFNHVEKMVRIAVRTLTLNVFRVREEAMLRFIRDCTAAPYFSNLSWFIGNNVLDIGNSLSAYIEHPSSNSPLPHSRSNFLMRLEDFVAEHLDHLHYINDILRLDIDDLNNVLSDNLLLRLMIPLYVHSFMSINFKFLVQKYSSTESESREKVDSNENVASSSTVSPSKMVAIDAILSPSAALFLLTQAYIIFSYGPLLKQLTSFLLNSNRAEIEENAQKCEFTRPNTSLEVAIEQAISSSTYGNANYDSESSSISRVSSVADNLTDESKSSSDPPTEIENILTDQPQVPTSTSPVTIFDWPNRPFLISLLATLNLKLTKQGSEVSLSSSRGNNNKNRENSADEIAFYKSCHSSKVIKLIPDLSSTDDRLILFTLSLISSIISNKAIDAISYRGIFVPNSPSASPSESENTNSFCTEIINSLLFIMRQCCSSDFAIRIVTFELTVHLFRRIVFYYHEPKDSKIFLTDHQLALLEQANEDACHMMRQHCRNTSKSVFLELFENEAKIMDTLMNHTTRPAIWSHNLNLNLEQLFMDSTLLLPSNEITPSESNFYIRLPNTDYEKTRYVVQVFFVLRRLSVDVRKVIGDKVDEKQLDFTPLFTEPPLSFYITLDQFIDLENCELNSCSLAFFYPINQRRNSGAYRDKRVVSHSSAPGSRSESPLMSSKKMPRFMTILFEHLILIEPDEKRYCWGVVRFIARMQDVDILTHGQAIHQISIPPIPDKDDPKSLYVYINRHQMSPSLLESKHGPNRPNLVRGATPSVIARFTFNDTVRAMVARTNISREHKKVIDRKMSVVANLIDMPLNEQSGGFASSSSATQSNDRRPFHPLLTRISVPGVAVLSKGEPVSGTPVANHTAESMANKKRYPYPPAVHTKSKASSSKTAANERRKKKSKPVEAMEAEELNAIPLSELSPKTMRKHLEETNVSSVVVESGDGGGEGEPCSSANSALRDDNGPVQLTVVLPAKSNSRSRHRNETFDI